MKLSVWIIPISLLALIAINGCYGSVDSAPRANMGSGATPGGSQDVGYFRGQVQAGGVPEASDITLEGFISEHDIPGSGNACNQVLCLEALVGNDRAVAEQGVATFVQLAMSSNVNLDNRARLPINLAVVVDVSGSMSGGNKLEYVKSGLLQMMQSLDAEDRLALITYSSTAKVLVPSQPVTDRTVFEESIRTLEPGGSTNLYDGMVLGYEQVAAHLAEGSLARVMLLSDGLANTGISSTELIVAKSAEYVDTGIGLTTIGVGLSFNHDLMRQLSEQGGGNFYFLEDPSKVTTVFQEELDFLVTPLANNLQINIAFDPNFELVDAFGFSYTWDQAGNMILEVPTVFASRRGGAMLIRVQTKDGAYASAGDVVADLSYLPLDDTGLVLAEVQGITDARFPSIDSPQARAQDGHGVLKSLVIWNMVESFHAVSNAFHLNNDSEAALTELVRLDEYVDDANLVLADQEIERDQRELIYALAINLGGYIGDPNYYNNEQMGHCGGGGTYYTVCGDSHDGPMPCGAAPGSTMPVLVVALLAVARRRRINSTAPERSANLT